jgi:hypothetical protein
MRSNDRLLALALGTAVTTFCIGACKKPAPERKKETSETELRSAERTVEAERYSIDEKRAYFAPVRREQLDVLGRLQAEIDGIDNKLAELKIELRGAYSAKPKSKDAARIRELLQRRAQLEEDKLTVERSDERGWAELKATIEQDLATKLSRPGY